MSMARAMARKMGMAWKMGMVRGLREEFAAKNWKLSSMVMDRGKLASVRHHSNMQRLREEIWDEVDIACSIDKECPYLSQYEHHCFWNNDYKSLKEYLQHLRTFNLDNKDMNPHFNPAEIQSYENELAEKTQKQALQIAHKIINRFNKDQSIKSGQKVKLEFARVVRVVDTYHRLVRRIVVEASNPDADAGIPFPPIIRLEATYNWYTGNPHRSSYLPPPYPDSPTLAPAPSSHSLPVAAHQAASTQAASHPKRHEIDKFDDEAAQVKLKEHRKQVEKKVLGKLGKDDDKLQNDTLVLRDEIKFLREESLRKDQEAKERNERLEKKLQIIMDKLHLTA